MPAMPPLYLSFHRLYKNITIAWTLACFTPEQSRARRAVICGGHGLLLLLAAVVVAAAAALCRGLALAFSPTFQLTDTQHTDSQQAEAVVVSVRRSAEETRRPPFLQHQHTTHSDPTMISYCGPGLLKPGHFLVPWSHPTKHH